MQYQGCGLVDGSKVDGALSRWEGEWVGWARACVGGWVVPSVRGWVRACVVGLMN